MTARPLTRSHCNALDRAALLGGATLDTSSRPVCSTAHGSSADADRPVASTTTFSTCITARQHVNLCQLPGKGIHMCMTTHHDPTICHSWTRVSNAGLSSPGS